MGLFRRGYWIRIYLHRDLFDLANPSQEGAIHACSDYARFSALLFLYRQIVAMFFDISFFHVERPCNQLLLGRGFHLGLHAFRRGGLLDQTSEIL